MKFQMAPTPSTLMSSGSKKREPRYVCLSGAKASHSHKIWTEDSSPVPHLLQMGILHSPIICRCLLKVLWPVSRPITTLDRVPLKDNNLDPVARLGPEINSRACLCVLQGPPHNARCYFSIQHFISLLTVRLETPRTVPYYSYLLFIRHSFQCRRCIFLDTDCFGKQTT
jgi:hypothetical protein